MHSATDKIGASSRSFAASVKPKSGGVSGGIGGDDYSGNGLRSHDDAEDGLHSAEDRPAYLDASGGVGSQRMTDEEVSALALVVFPPRSNPRGGAPAVPAGFTSRPEVAAGVALPLLVLSLCCLQKERSGRGEGRGGGDILCLADDIHSQTPRVPPVPTAWTRRPAGGRDCLSLDSRASVTITNTRRSPC